MEAEAVVEQMRAKSRRCFGKLRLVSFGPPVKLRKQKYERLGGGKVGVGKLNAATEPGQKGGFKAVLVMRVRGFYRQSLEMARQSGPHLRELFRGNSFLLSPVVSAPATPLKLRSNEKCRCRHCRHADMPTD
ncbi:hypothetical protein KP509_17G069000 [Ceratopteris richardii]|uniref:Uncharacterized protein n=1 Tax=Ceratopteris richardii TaxID=49495 RepID=A0A8T2SXX7_CERRI|nr:hypothetical protein KP509_17G069000 [Ceratopteris richardii]